MTVWQLPWSTDKGGLNEIKHNRVLLAIVSIVLHVEYLNLLSGPMDIFWTHSDSPNWNTEKITTLGYSHAPEKKKLPRNTRANEGGK